MAIDDLTIVNSALLRIADKPVTLANFAAPPTDAARLAQQLYPPTRDEELMVNPWIFSLLRTTLLAYRIPKADLTPGSGADVEFTEGVSFVSSVPVFEANDLGRTIESQVGLGKAVITAVSTGLDVALATITEAFRTPLTKLVEGDWWLFNAPPANTWLRTIGRPANCLRLWWVRHREPYRAEGQYFVCNAAQLE